MSLLSLRLLTVRHASWAARHTMPVLQHTPKRRPAPLAVPKVVTPPAPPAWLVQRNLTLRLKALPSAADVLLEVKDATATMNLRNLSSALHIIASKVRLRLLGAFPVCVSPPLCFRMLPCLCSQLSPSSVELRLSVIGNTDFVALVHQIAARLSALQQPQHASLRLLSTIFWSLGKLGTDVRLPEGQERTDRIRAGIKAQAALAGAASKLLMLHPDSTVGSTMRAGTEAVGEERDGWQWEGGKGWVKVEGRGDGIPPSDLTRLVWGMAAFPYSFASPPVRAVFLSRVCPGLPCVCFSVCARACGCVCLWACGGARPSVSVSINVCVCAGRVGASEQACE
ncbi:MAG: hypothetical protein P4L40_21525 [Terracidiphilus sp.]|nr:hypothetical protein [Terracidiphilus sp.]